MAISRRLRFEILRRDGHRCRYCGAAAPDVTLTVDHVIPDTLGGGDDPTNLVTACTACNAGKSSIAPDQQLVADVDATAMLFAKATERAAAIRRNDHQAATQLIDWFDTRWRDWTMPNGEPLPRDPNWRASIARFHEAGLNATDLDHLLSITMDSDITNGGAWRYLCGCCWREISTRHELARRLIEDGEV